MRSASPPQLFLDPDHIAEKASKNGLHLARSHVLIMMSFLDGAAVVLLMASILREGELILRATPHQSPLLIPTLDGHRSLINPRC